MNDLIVLREIFPEYYLGEVQLKEHIGEEEEEEEEEDDDDKFIIIKDHLMDCFK